MLTGNRFSRFYRSWIAPDRAILLFCVLLITLVWGGAFWQVERDRQITIDNVMHDCDKFSRAFEEHVRQILKTHDQYLLLLKNEFEGTQAVTPAITRLISQIGQDPLAIQLALEDETGGIRISLRPFSPGVNFADLPHVKIHRTADTGQLYIGRTFTGRVTGVSSIPLSRRLNYPDGSFAGIAYVSLNPEYFTKFYRDMDFNEHYTVRVLGLDGYARASNTSRDMGIDMSKALLFEELAKAPAGFFRTSGRFFGEVRLMSYRQMSDYPLVVQVGVTEEILAPMLARRTAYFGAAGGMSLFILLYTGRLVVRTRRERQAEALMRASEEKYNKAFHTSPDSININRLRDGLYIDSNGGFTRMTGFTREDVIGKTSLDISIWADPADRSRLVAGLQQDGEVLNLEAKFRRKDGKVQYGLMSARRIAVAGEDCILSITRNINDRKEAELALAASRAELAAAHEELTANDEELRQQFDELQTNWELLAEKDRALWALFNNMHDAFALHEIICDAAGNPVDYRFLAVNPAFERLVDISADRLIGRTVLEVVPNTETHWIEKYGKVALTGEAMSFSDHSRELNRFYSVAAYCPQPGQFAVLALDVTEQKRHEETVRHLAYHDDLTGLPNRAYYQQDMARVLVEAAGANDKFTVMFLDLNNFKRINDAFGHAAGDEFLRTVASRLQSCMRSQDTVARMGGDEFTVIIPGTYEVHAVVAVARRIIAAVNEPWRYQGHDFHIGTSVGIAIYPWDGEDADTLLKSADMAMYKAKGKGNNSFHFYTEDIHISMLDRVSLETGLHQAIKDGEFVLHYQPQVDETGRIIGVEALLRWQHPTRGLLYPGDFLEIAEATGLMIPIGEWTLRTACAQAVGWQQAGYAPVRMSVNLSANQFQDPNLLPMVRSALADAKMAPALLELEITETLAMTKAELTDSVSTELQAMGISLALDDFGTGYSSLRYLKAFTINTLKIDKSFVQDIDTDLNNRAIVKAIMALSETLQLAVTAEGVETALQRDCLLGLGCHKMQGYYFSRPVAPKKIAEMLAAAK
ncbi:MAG: EAL domain-containing protein [Negativicutes bacterium]|nr:EAL domain-containing protein [Negativicutes bacterium]